MVPACPLLFGSEAHGHGGFASQPIQRQRSHEGEILRAFTCTGAVRRLPHRDIQHPLHPVFTLPVRASPDASAAHRHPCGRQASCGTHAPPAHRRPRATLPRPDPCPAERASPAFPEGLSRRHAAQRAQRTPPEGRPLQRLAKRARMLDHESVPAHPGTKHLRRASFSAPRSSMLSSSGRVFSPHTSMAFSSQGIMASIKDTSACPQIMPGLQGYEDHSSCAELHLSYEEKHQHPLGNGWEEIFAYGLEAAGLIS